MADIESNLIFMPFSVSVVNEYGGEGPPREADWAVMAFEVGEPKALPKAEGWVWAGWPKIEEPKGDGWLGWPVELDWPKRANTEKEEIEKKKRKS